MAIIVCGQVNFESQKKDHLVLHRKALCGYLKKGWLVIFQWIKSNQACTMYN
jgi:hypothetical protein